MRINTHAGGVLALVLTSSGCTDATSNAPEVIRTDSAGVEIVRTTRAQWEEGKGWSVDPEPVLSIGEVAGDPDYLFGAVEGAIRIGDRILVADEQTLNIRYYDVTGRHLLTAGGPGTGPGELRILLQFERCEGEQAYAFDVSDLTIHVRGPDGALMRELRVSDPGTERARHPFAMACSAAGSGFVAAGLGEPTTSDRSAGVILRHMSPVWLLDRDWQVTAQLGHYLSTERILSFNSQTGLPNGGGPHPFGRSISVALGIDQVYVGTGESLTVDVYERDGRLTRRLQGPDEDLLISPEFTAEYRNRELDVISERLRSMLAVQGYPMPTSFPAYTEMHVDPDGALWVKRWAPPWDSANRWGIFGPEGLFLGHLDLPARMVLTDLGRDWILGIVPDDLGVHRVQMYHLLK